MLSVILKEISCQYIILESLRENFQVEMVKHVLVQEDLWELEANIAYKMRSKRARLLHREALERRRGKPKLSTSESI